jgi:adenylate cyclase
MVGAVKPRITSVRGLGGLLAGMLLAAGIGFLLHEFGVGRKARSLSYDLLLVARPAAHPDEAVVIYLDEVSHEKLGQPLNAPWDRALHAQLLDRLTRAGARAVVFDIVFSDPSTNAAADRALADAIRRHGNVVLAADHVRIRAGEKKFLPPIPLLLEAATAGRIGSAEMQPDHDLIIRRLPSNEDIFPSLSWVAATMVNAPPTTSPANPAHERWMNYYRPANSTPACSYFEALDTNAVPDSFFAGKVAFIGARIMTKFAGDRKDEFATPHSAWVTGENPFISGVELQATAFLNLQRGDWLTRASFTAERAAILLFGLAVGLVLVRLRPGAASLLALLVGVAIAFAAYQAFLRTRVWLPWLILEAQLAAAWLWGIGYNSVRLYVEKRLLEHSLALYLSPKLVKKFARDRDRSLLRPGAEKQTLTILFSDIAGFTSISEGMDSDELARMMNDYFQSAVAHCIHPADGTVVKYIGDAIFAFWNAPEPQADHAVRACQAALRFRDESQKTFRGRKLPTRIGLHTGVANVGNFGSATRVDYTAVGESINLAARMEGLNKHLGTTLLITGATKQEIGDRFHTRYLGRFRLKGFERMVEVHELCGSPNGTGAIPRHEEFDRALRHFQQREFAAAEQAFTNVLAANSSDGPARFYLRVIADLRGREVPETWSGEVELTEK